jgi:hypothetical protein
MTDSLNPKCCVLTILEGACDLRSLCYVTAIFVTLVLLFIQEQFWEWP